MNRHIVFVACAAMLVANLAATGCSPSSPEPAATASAHVSDMDVTEHVKTALHQDEALKGFDITVITLKGDVRLIGKLNTQAQIDAAVNIARAADGAHSIHDELTLQ